MKLPALACLIVLAPLAHGDSADQPASPYAGQETRDIKSLSAVEVDAYLTGKGLGMAKAAELNGFAGPRHVLELASELALTPEQRAQTETLFASMQLKASTLGRALVDKERQLDQLFASRAITSESLKEALDEIGSLQARLRGAHLEAHLAQSAILTAGQNARYVQLRGYGGAHMHAGHDKPPPAP